MKRRGGTSRLQDMLSLLCEHVLVYVFAWVCVNAWRKKRYIVSIFSLERLWYASKMPTAVTASSTKCISGKHTQMHTNAHRLLPSHLRKTLQMCLGNCSTLGGKSSLFFFPFFYQKNKQQQTFQPRSTKWWLPLRSSRPSMNKSVLAENFSHSSCLPAIKPIRAKWNKAGRA